MPKWIFLNLVITYRLIKSIYILFQNAEDCYINFCFPLHTNALFTRVCYLFRGGLYSTGQQKGLSVTIICFFFLRHYWKSNSKHSDEHGIVILKISLFNMKYIRNWEKNGDNDSWGLWLPLQTSFSKEKTLGGNGHLV